MAPCWRHFHLLFLSLILVLNFVGLTIAQHYCVESSGNFTTNSTYQRNLDTLLSSITTNMDSYGFYSSSVGENSNRVYGIALCGRDADQASCHSCIGDGISNLTQLCPNSRGAMKFSHQCWLRYSNESLLGNLAEIPIYAYCNTTNVSNEDQFNQELSTLLRRHRSTAASGGQRLKFAYGKRIFGFTDTIYAVEQCTPDLSDGDCIQCLDFLAGTIPERFNGKRGAQIGNPSCMLRYELYPFVNVSNLASHAADAPPPLRPPDDALPPLQPDAPPTSSGKDDTTTQTVILIVVPTITFVFILILCIFIVLRKKKQRKPGQKVETEDEIIAVGSLQYDFDTIRIATDNFSESNKLGRGGFGAVYKGRLPNGQEIAVKRLSKDSGQGDLEFKNEVILMAKLQHRNLVRLFGFCLKGAERLLIYEFVTNSSLDRFIFDPIKPAHLDWDNRYKIIGGIARGLLYLHEDSRLRIVHRDLKASNVLLDTEMNPKIADFGLARLFVVDETQGNTSRIVGTYGYMAPEYAMRGHFSVKSDVFSFGVLILEIISGQKNNCFRNGENVEDLLSYAWKSWKEGTTSNLIDPIFRAGSNLPREMMRCIHIGLLCVQDNVTDRPSMASVVPMLSNFSFTLPLPSEPRHFLHSSISPEMPSRGSFWRTESSQSQSKSITHVSINEASITELYPR